MGDRAKQRRLGQSMKGRSHRTRRLLSLTLATAVVTGGLPSAWAQVTAETTHPSNVSYEQLALQSGPTANVEGSARLEEARRLNDQGVELYQAGRYAEAEPLLLQTLEIYREQLGDRHSLVATSLNNLAVLYVNQGRYEEAELFYQEALEINREQLGDRHPDVARSLNNLAVLYQAQGRIDTALTYLQQGLDVQETNLTLNLAIGSEDRKQAYIATVAGTTNYAFSLHFQDAPDNQDAAHLAFTTLLRSGLAFAGFNSRSSAGEDGVLTALEAAGLRLRGTRLVVMSACETGVGSVATGEGVYGLRRAFVMAGAESQLMSLWKVDDYGTAELMQLYYERILGGEERSEALRQVQLDLLAAPAYAHPYYWSSFLFSGDWRPLDGTSDQQPAQP